MNTKEKEQDRDTIKMLSRDFLVFTRIIPVKQMAEQFNILPEGQLLLQNILTPRAAFC